MLTAKNAKEWFTDKEQADPIALFVHDANKRSALSENDIILSTRGTVGLCALVTSEVLPANIDQDVARVSFSRTAPVLPGYLVAYLNSSFGQDHMSRYASGMVQQGLSLQKVREIPIPIFAMEFQKMVSGTVHLALSKNREASDQQAQAEQTHLRALGLENWQPPEPLTYTRRASEALAEGRLDAEFHRPKVESLRQILSSRFAIKSLSELGVVENGQTVPYAEAGEVPIIRSGDLSNIDDDSRFLSATSTAPIFRLEPGDILVSSIGFGSIGKIQVFDKPGTYGTVSEVTVIRQKKLNPYFVAAFLRSLYGQMQIDRYITGATGQLHLYKRDVRKIFIPVIPTTQQQQFETFARASFSARQQAQSLLERAKRAVEIAIEQGEEAGMALLK